MYQPPSLHARIADLHRQERIAEAATWQRSSEAIAASRERTPPPPGRGGKLANAVATFFALILAFLVDRRVQATLGVALVIITGLLLLPERIAV